MSAAAERGSRKGPGLRLVLWIVLFLGGTGLWLLYLGGAETDRAWRAFLVNFLFFTSLAGGLVTWSAVVQASNGRWPGRLEGIPLTGMGFALPSLLALLVLWLASSQWSPWYGKTFEQGIWLENSLVFARNMAALAIFWGMALWYWGRRRRGYEGKVLAGWLIVVYCWVFSLLGFDLVMALDPHWYSSLAGGYFFISGLYIAVAAWALLSSAAGSMTGKLHDLGKLVFAFSILTTYMMYSQLLPIYYENLPHETRFLLPRMSWPWKGVSWILLATAYLGPLILLLMIRAKRNRWYLGAVSLLVLLAMWIERWWLVAPHFHPHPVLGGVEIAITLGFLGLAAASMEMTARQLPSFAGREPR